ncbi:hypothetical protein D9758_015901 [Tetrapyrgos nigripes]|uniref:Uncharacterized protein n=1 Tax=Tetrapyrgos nigripes TaxID=182062 RepID=A0A8H5CLB1_9AGAR|nr:hypothetical protein D9758_015901 [Tetrapyrgos nigripes]
MSPSSLSSYQSCKYTVSLIDPHESDVVLRVTSILPLTLVWSLNPRFTANTFLTLLTTAVVSFLVASSQPNSVSRGQRGRSSLHSTSPIVVGSGGSSTEVKQDLTSVS